MSIALDGDGSFAACKYLLAQLDPQTFCNTEAYLRSLANKVEVASGDPFVRVTDANGDVISEIGEPDQAGPVVNVTIAPE